MRGVVARGSVGGVGVELLKVAGQGTGIHCGSRACGGQPSSGSGQKGLGRALEDVYGGVIMTLDGEVGAKVSGILVEGLEDPAYGSMYAALLSVATFRVAWGRGKKAAIYAIFKMKGGFAPVCIRAAHVQKLNPLHIL